MISRKFIWVTLEEAGFHSYETAPGEVDFLRNRHRHLFKIKVWLEVFNMERDIEFIIFKNFLDIFKIEVFLKYDGSCEEYCDIFYKEINKKYPNRDVKISISEDGENGAEVEYPKNVVVKDITRD